MKIHENLKDFQIFKTIQIIIFKLYLNSHFQTSIYKMYRRGKKRYFVINFQECFKICPTLWKIYERHSNNLLEITSDKRNKDNRFITGNFYYSKYSEIFHHCDSIDVPRKSSHKKRVKSLFNEYNWWLNDWIRGERLRSFLSIKCS